jgi:hypothetical protein
MRQIICLMIALIASHAHAQQKVYKCVVNGVVTFSQQECGKDAQPIMDIPKQAPAAPGSDSAQQNLKAISDSVADSQCRRDAQKLAYDPDMSEINNLKAQVRDLESSRYVSVRTGVENANAQQLAAADRARAAGLRAVIATKEQQNATMRAEADRTVREALRQCDQQKAQH